MACAGGGIEIRVERSVGTCGTNNTGAGTFHPLFRVVVRNTAGVRYWFLFNPCTGSAEAARAWRGSNDDGRTFGAVTAIDSYAAAGTSWNKSQVTFDPPGTTYDIIEYGVLVRNTGSSSTSRNIGKVTANIETRED